MSAAQATSNDAVPATDRAAHLVETAIATLTELARVTYPSPDGGSGRRVDFTDLLAGIVSSVAANVDGVEALLAGRPGSWEADLVHQLVSGAVGWDEEYLPLHRTEPIRIDIDAAALLYDRTDGAWDRAWELAWDRATDTADTLYDTALELHDGEDWVAPPIDAIKLYQPKTPAEIQAAHHYHDLMESERARMFALHPDVAAAYTAADAILTARDTAEDAYEAALLAAATAKATELGYDVPVTVQAGADSWLGERLLTHALDVTPTPQPPGTAETPATPAPSGPVEAGDESTEGQP